MKRRLLLSLLISALIASAASCGERTAVASDKPLSGTDDGAHSSYSTTSGGSASGTAASGTTASSTTTSGTTASSTTTSGTTASSTTTSGMTASSTATSAETTGADASAATTSAVTTSAATTTAAGSAYDSGDSFAVTTFYAGDAMEYPTAAAAEAAGMAAEAAPSAYDFDSYKSDSFAMADAEGAFAPECDTKGYDTFSQARAGLLTGGEWNDNCNFNFWKTLLGQREDWKSLPASWRLNTTNRIFVRVSAKGSPACGLTVKLMDGDDEVWQSVTDSKGEAFLFAGIYSKSTAVADKILVETPDGQAVTCEIPEGCFGSPKPIEIDISTAAPMRTDLDLMLMVDTTGSMADELRFLQRELTSVIDRIKNDSGVDVQLSVNFYRDTGDDYVVRDFEFTSDISQAVDYLEEQRAAGGGDYPEAVTKALSNGINDHNWRKNSEKLMILVLDAPPHTENASELAGLMTSASRTGIRIIPVASSGVDTDTEFLCRSMAIATGGTYTFLTDDSGVGFSHLEPTIGDYDVEKLNDMLVRIINDYFSQEPRQHSTETPELPEPKPVETEPYPVFPRPIPDMTGTMPTTPEPVEGTYKTTNGRSDSSSDYHRTGHLHP